MGATPSEEKVDTQENIHKTFRLHVGGLGPTILPQDLQKRFSSFGTVLKVDGVGKLDANGSPLHYAFVDMLSTDPQITRCMNLLSGTTYKGNTLRIAPARPDYMARALREKANLPINTFVDPDEEALQEREEKAKLKLERKLAKIRARKRGIEGYQSSNLELMTIQRFKSRQGVNGWKKDPETSLPIFPIITRPLRPLPPLGLTHSQDSEAKQESHAIRVPNRARRIRIDPTLYRAAIKHRKTHILGPRAISIEQYKLGFVSGAKILKKSRVTRPMWDCCLGEEGHIIWRLQGDDADQEERVQLSSYTRKTIRDAGESCTYESYPAHFVESSSFLQQTESNATLAPVNPPANISSKSEQEGLHSPEAQTQDLKLPNPHTASTNAVPPMPDPILTSNVSESYEGKASSIPIVQGAPLDIESTSNLGPEACSSLPSTFPLRLRGGSSVKKKVNHDNTQDVQLSNLTDMFKAKEDEKKGFSLNDALEGVELDESMPPVEGNFRTEVASSSPDVTLEKVKAGKQLKSKASIHPSRLNGSTHLTSQVTTSMKPGERKGTFFFYPTDEDPDSQVINSLLSPELRENARKHWLSQDLPSSSNGWRSFLTTESISQIESEHNQKKSQLTEHMRRKHKDALKQERKRGTRLGEL